MVVVVHTRGFFFAWDTAPAVFLVLRAFGTLGVPLFVLLSGYLMFDRPYEDPMYLKHYMSSNLLPLIVSFELWNVLWFILDQISFLAYPGGGFPIDAERAIKSALFIGDTGSALWYLPMTIGLYLGIPIASVAIRKLADFDEKYTKLILFALFYFGTVIPSSRLILQFAGHEGAIHSVLSMNIFGASVWGDSVWMLYILSGWAIKNERLRRIPSIMLLLCGFIIPLISAIALDYLAVVGIGKTPLQAYSFILYVIMAISLFELLVRQEDRLSRVNGRILLRLAGLSRASFCIYMVHLFIFGLMYHIGVPDVCLGLAVPTRVFAYIAVVAVVVVLSRLVAVCLCRVRCISRWLLLMK